MPWGDGRSPPTETRGPAFEKDAETLLYAAPASPVRLALESDLPEESLHGLLFDPFSEAFRSDPYPIYRKLRETRPFHYHPAGFWVASRYADCDGVLRDRRFRTVDPHAWQTELQVQATPKATQFLQDYLSRTMLFASPPAHLRYRRPLNRAFAPKVVEQRRARIREIAETLIQRFPGSGTFDFMEAFASPFPILLVADLLGVPVEDQARIAAWSRTISPILDPLQRPEAIEAAAATMAEFDAYMRGLLRRRRIRPEGDLISIMQEPAEDGTILTEDELVANIGFILAAGHGTATHLMGNGLWLLQRHGAWAELRTDRSFLPTAVDEVLRCEPPAQMTVREAMEPVFVADRRIEKGRRIVVLIGAANRDPAVFPNPESFDPRRKPNEHLAFSAGVHYCLGAALARIEGEEAFGALLDHAPTLRLAGDGSWQRTITMRGFRRLPVAR